MGNRALPGGPPLQGAHLPSPKQYNIINNIKDSTYCPGAQSVASGRVGRVLARGPRPRSRGPYRANNSCKILKILLDS